MGITVLVPCDEIREEDLQIGVRVRIQWDPNENKATAIGKIEHVRKWRGQHRLQNDEDYEIIIRIMDELTGLSREASMDDQWIDIISARNSDDPGYSDRI